MSAFLLSNGYVARGINRRATHFDTVRFDHLYRDPHEEDVSVFPHHGSVTDSSFVVATEVRHSVRGFVTAAGAELGISISREGGGLEEKGYDARGRCIVRVDPRYFRPAEADTLLGDATKAREVLGWSPTTNFDDLVREMIQEGLEAAQRDQLVKKHGFQVHDRHE